MAGWDELAGGRGESINSQGDSYDDVKTRMNLNVVGISRGLGLNQQVEGLHLLVWICR